MAVTVQWIVLPLCYSFLMPMTGSFSYMYFVGGDMKGIGVLFPSVSSSALRATTPLMGKDTPLHSFCFFHGLYFPVIAEEEI